MHPKSDFLKLGDSTETNLCLLRDCVKITISLVMMRGWMAMLINANFSTLASYQIQKNVLMAVCYEQEWLLSFPTFVPLTEKGSGKKTQ